MRREGFREEFHRIKNGFHQQDDELALVMGRGDLVFTAQERTAHAANTVLIMIKNGLLAGTLDQEEPSPFADEIALIAGRINLIRSTKVYKSGEEKMDKLAKAGRNG